MPNHPARGCHCPEHEAARARDRGRARKRPNYTGPRGDDVPICEQCGRRHLTIYGTQACAGHVTTDRASYVPGQPRNPLPEPRPCGTFPRNGSTVCVNHGASAPHVVDAAAAREQRAEAEQLMTMLGEPVPGDPGEIIAERIAVRYGHVQWLLARVRALDPDALTWGLTKRKTAVARDVDDDTRRRYAGTDEGDTHEAKPSIWYALYLEAADKLERLCIEAIRVGLDERRVQLAEREADLWVRLIDGVLAELGHDPNDPQTAEIVARHLEAVA